MSLFNQILIVAYALLLLKVPNMTVTIIALILILFIQQRIHKKNVNKKTKIFIGIGILTLIYLFTINFSYPEKMYSSNLTMLLIFVSTFLWMFILIEKGYSEKRIKAFKEIMFYLGSILAIYGVFINLFGELDFSSAETYQTIKIGFVNLSQLVMGREPFIRITSLTQNPNVLAMILNFSIISGLSLMKTNKKLKIKILLIIQIIAMILTYSKTGIIITTILLTLFFLYNYMNKDKKKLFIIFFALFIIIGIFTDIPIDNQRFNFDLNSREDVWQVAIEEIVKHPFRPVGFPNSEYFLKEINDSESLMHNSYLMLALEIGIIPTVLIYGTWILIIICLHFNENRNASKFLIIANIILLLQQFTEAQMFRYNILHFIGIYIISQSILLLSERKFKDEKK